MIKLDDTSEIEVTQHTKEGFFALHIKTKTHTITIVIDKERLDRFAAELEQLLSADEVLGA